MTMVAAAAKKEFDAPHDHPAQVADGMANLGRRSADGGGEESSWARRPSGCIASPPATGRVGSWD